MWGFLFILFFRYREVLDGDFCCNDLNRYSYIPSRHRKSGDLFSASKSHRDAMNRKGMKKLPITSSESEHNTALLTMMSSHQDPVPSSVTPQTCLVQTSHSETATVQTSRPCSATITSNTSQARTHK
jgi:hypothetical protein